MNRVGLWIKIVIIIAVIGTVITADTVNVY